MKFSLINIHHKNGNKIDGSWLQNHIGTLESAIEVAIKTEQANSNKIKVAVVEELFVTNPILNYFENLTQLNI